LLDKDAAMTTPHIAQTSPILLDVEEGKTYWWCSCGLSRKQPFCDGSHKGSDFSPVAYTASQTRKVAFCGCKQTGSQPLCDGAHKAL